MYPTEEQIKIHNDEEELNFIAGIALSICRGDIVYKDLLKKSIGGEIKSEVDKMIRHYLSLPQYKHLPKPKGFEM